MKRARRSRLATAWGYLAAEQIERARALLDEVMAMLWRSHASHSAVGCSSERPQLA